MLTFPDIAPVIPEATNGGSSFTEDITDSTITVTTDANYKKTRPRTTRMISKWTFSWSLVSDADYKTLMDFYRKVGKFDSFTLKNWIDDKEYEVRITEKGEWQWYPYGWQGSFTFEEV